MSGRAQTVVIALDQGSSTSRALAIDSKGKVVARAQLPIRTFYPHSGWVEHDPMDIVRSQERTLDAVLARLPATAEVLGIGIADRK
ncbi:MAG: FGGY family carbohydrate kinase, partial [Elusimicrobiota bacterium]